MVGIVVFESINFVIIPPIVSIPKESGVTSNNKTSLTSPDKTPPCIAAPNETTSSGLTPFDGFLLKNFSTSSWTIGIRVEPPTNITSSISTLDKLASVRAFLQGSSVLLTNPLTRDSNLDLLNFEVKCLGPSEPALKYGRLISVSVDADNSIFAFSAASLIL